MAELPKNLAVLLVDDDDLIRRLVRSFLRDLNCREIREARNGEEALPLLTSRLFDVLIFDWQMEPINGLDLTRLVRGNSENPNQRTPIIVLTAHTERENVLAARDAGATAVVAKPVSSKNLTDKIAFALKNPVAPPRAGANGAAPDGRSETSPAR